MERLGLRSLFPMRDINHVGGTAIVANLPRILSRMRQAAREVAKADPDVYVIIDCPGFNLGVARRVRQEAAIDPDRRLRLADRVGLAAAAGAVDGRLRRPCPRHPALRAGGAQAAEGPALHLCRPPADREARPPAPGAGRAPAYRRGRAAEPHRPSGQPPWRDHAAPRRVRRDGGARRRRERADGSAPARRSALRRRDQGADCRMAGEARGSSRARRRNTPPSGADIWRSPPPAP